jgi:hypothetical protein
MHHHAEAEDEVWQIVRDYFSDIRLSPKAYTALFGEMDREQAARTPLPQETRLRKLAWEIGHFLLPEYSEGCCRECFAYAGPASPEARDPCDLSRPSEHAQRWNVWRRILRVENPMVLERPWRAAYELVDSIVGKAGDGSLNHFQCGWMNFDKQEHFFMRLFDPNVERVSR